MFRRFSSLLGSSAVLTTALFLGGTPAVADHGGGHGGGGGHYHGGHYHGGHYHGGAYHGGYYGPYHHFYGPGFYRPYYGYGFGGFGLGGLGLGGFGLGGPGLGLGGYGLGGGYGPYLPYGGGGPSVVVVNPPTTLPNNAAAPPAQTQPPPDNAAHLQLAVPENAEVLFEGAKTTQTGPIREFVSPQLTAGKVFTYTIVVRYTNADGKPINDKRLIHVRANDWFRIDFTRPAPPEQTPVPRPE